MSQAVRICPDLVVVPTNIDKYRAESVKIHKIFTAYTTLIEPLSLDEAYLDVTHASHAGGSATLIAREIREKVRQHLGITISAGIAPNKFLAKIASDWNKPDGQFTISPDQVQTFVARLPVNKILGVGTVTARRMQDLGIYTCADLQKQSITKLNKHFGKFGTRLYDLCRGQDERPVKTQRIRKSLSVERTYERDLATRAACTDALEVLLGELENRIARADCAHRIAGRTIKVRFSDFDTTTAANIGTLINLQAYQQLFDIAWERQKKAVRLIGIGVRLNNADTDFQLSLFED